MHGPIVTCIICIIKLLAILYNHSKQQACARFCYVFEFSAQKALLKRAKALSAVVDNGKTLGVFKTVVDTKGWVTSERDCI